MATKLSLYNLALGKLGIPASGRITSIDQNHKGRAALDNVYHAQRQRELRRNYWSFGISRKKVRAMQATDLLVRFPTWDQASGYGTGQIISYGTVPFYNRSDVHYIAVDADVTAQDPANLPGQYGINEQGIGFASWYLYWGPVVATLYSASTQYYKGELVYIAGITPDVSQVFLALVDPTIGVTPVNGAQWKLQVDTFCQASPYSLPISGRTTAYLKPRDLLRIAPLDPKRSDWMNDQLVEGDAIVTSDPGPILDLRYVSEVTYTDKFDVMFTEALACNLAHETTDEMTQSNVKKSTLIGLYDKAIGDARLVNAIEGYGSIESEEDDWVTCRNTGIFPWR